MSDKPLTLSAFQQKLGDTIRMNPSLQSAWIVAELSDVRVAGGHCYMELIEKDEASGQVMAKMRAMIWNNTYRSLLHRFLSATGSGIESGMKVMICGSATHHNMYGLSFSINDIDPNYTLGDIERQRREILDRLRREGVIDNNRNLEFPEVPQKIAVISAEGAAGYGDFMNHLQHSSEGFQFYPLLIPAVMQGERTAGSVMDALDFVESTIDFWDCAVIIRGGGSTTDMHGFDSYPLAKRVAEFPLPVVVGIGHERDRNVLDEIACRRCKTPTAVADFLVECCRGYWTEVGNRVKDISGYVSERLHGEALRLNNIENLLPSKVNRAVMREEGRIKDYIAQIERIASRRLSGEESRIEVDRVRLMTTAQNATEKPKVRLQRLEDMLRVLSPENTLRRGYSITRLNGRAVYRGETLKAGDVLETELAGGKVKSKVINS